MRTMQNSNGTDPKKKSPSINYPHCWPLVKITWMDAMDGDTGWVELKKMLKGQMATAIDIGWMIKKDSKKIILIASWCLEPDDKNGGRYITIPRGWVKKIEYLKVDDGKIRD